MVMKSFIAFSLVLFAGGAIFMVLERGEAGKSLSPKREVARAKALVLLRYNISKKEMNEIFGNIEKAMQQNGVKEPYKWDYYESCFFVGSLLTTIGYGHIAPKTTYGQLATILYSLLGIPLAVLVVRRISNKIIDKVILIVQFASTCINNRIASATENAERESISEQNGPKNPVTPRRKWKRKKKQKRNRREKIASVVVLFTMVFLFITFSSMLRVHLEGWTPEQSIYFWFNTLTTTGFGDFVPFEGRQPPSMVLTVIYYSGTFYLLFGLALIASLIQSISELFEGVLPPAVSPWNRANSVSQTHNFDLEVDAGKSETPKQPNRLEEQLHTEGEAKSLHEATVGPAVAWCSTGTLNLCLPGALRSQQQTQVFKPQADHAGH